MGYATYSLDVDGLIADFLAGAFTHIAEQGGGRYSHEDVTAWRMTAIMTSEEDKALFLRFVDSPESYGDLPLLTGAREAVAELRQLADAEGAQIVVASHAPLGALPYRKAWLDRNGITYDDIIVSPNAKAECLERYGAEGPMLFIDDDPATAKVLGLPREGVDLLVVKGDLPRAGLPHEQKAVGSWAEVGRFLRDAPVPEF